MHCVWGLFVSALALVSCSSSVETAIGSPSASSADGAVLMTFPPMVADDILVSADSSPEEIELKLQVMADSDFEESTNEYDSTISCDGQFPDAKVISADEFIDGLVDAVDSVEERDTYDFVTRGGTRIRSGPRALWMQEAFEKYLAIYEPSQFKLERRGENNFRWSDYIRCAKPCVERRQRRVRSETRW